MVVTVHRLTLIGPILELNHFIKKHEALCFLKLPPSFAAIAFSSRYRERLALSPTDAAIEYIFDVEENPWNSTNPTPDDIAMLAAKYPGLKFQHEVKTVGSDW